MDKHYFLSVWVYNPNNTMGKELSVYVYEKYNHVVVSADDIYDVKYDIQMKMRELEEQNKWCKPFCFECKEISDIYGEKEPYITVKSDAENGTFIFYIHAAYIRNAILDYKRQ